jgi:uncharacterized membrane protein
MYWLQERALWVVIAGGAAVTIVVGFATHGLPYDIESWRETRAALSSHPLHVYALTNVGGNFHWPYPPGFFPLVAVTSGLADLFGGGFTHLVRLPAVIANGALAWLVWYGLEDRADAATKLLAAALVALGPVFIAVAGYSAQIDAVAILPGVGALLVWERLSPGRRAPLAGLLIGIAAAFKTVPIIMLLALLPTASSLREAVTLVACALAVLLLAFAPWLIADFSHTAAIRHYAGSPGMGGLSLVLQPNLAERWLTRLVAPTGLTTWLFVKHASALNVVVLAAFAGFAARFRPAPRLAAALLWLVVLCFGSGFFFQYLVWAIPFLLLAGYVLATAVLEAVVTVPMVIYYAGPWHQQSIVYVYVPLMLALWCGWVALAAILIRRSTVPAGAAALA